MRHRKARIYQRRPGPISFPRVTIGSLPDHVLLDVFDFCQMPLYESPRWWHALVHVCRRWRYIVFESPLRLHLRLVCNANTPVTQTLAVWPRAFPIVIEEWRSRLLLNGVKHIIAALQHHDRVSEIVLYSTTCTLLKRLYKVMTKPYPVLTNLHLEFEKTSAPVVPGTFLDRSAPRLKVLSLIGIPFPALPKRLPFCHQLVKVHLANIPNTGYISPEATATALSALTKLQFVYIGFESPASRPDPTNRPPSSFTRVVLPTLTHLEFHGTSEYFEDLVARIDTPAIISVYTWYFNRLEFDIPHLLQFIGRTWIPGSFEETKLYCGDESVQVNISRRDPLGGFWITLSIAISSHGLDWQVGCLAQICSKISPFLSNVEWLSIFYGYPKEVFYDWKDYVDNPQWLEIFHAFSALQHIRIPPELGEIIASALQELTEERVMDALPMLHHLYLLPPSASTQQAIKPFISSHQRSNHPVTVHLTEMV